MSGCELTLFLDISDMVMQTKDRLSLVELSDTEGALSTVDNKQEGALSINDGVVDD